MRLLKFDDHGELCLTRDLHVNIPRYAILSHTWGPDEDEVSFDDFMSENGKSLPGYAKIRSCGEQAKKDGLDYFWVDTCCIDKRSSSELSEAINSMYRWYAEAVVCYALLSDIDASSLSEPYALLSDIDASSLSDADAAIEGLALTNSVWFTRGWTLQELLAPKELTFFNRDWTPVGSKAGFCYDIERHTGIPSRALLAFKPSDYCIGQRMAWAADRKTTRVEDHAYCLFGLFSINMPLLYGEREKAFRRLQEELIQNYNDTSIFAWSGVGDPENSMLASSPGCFSASTYSSNPWNDIRAFKDDQPFQLSKRGIQGNFSLFPYTLDISILSLSYEIVHHLKVVQTGVFVLAVGNSRDRYRRVIVDGKHLFDRGPPRWLQRDQRKRSVLIVRDLPVEVDSTRLRHNPNVNWHYIIWSWGSRIYLPAQTKIKAPRGLEHIYPWRRWELNRKLFLQRSSGRLPDSVASKCLCIFRIKDDLGSKFPAVILRLNLDVYDQPVVVVSEVLCKSGQEYWDSLKIGTWKNEENREGIYADTKSVLSSRTRRSSVLAKLKALVIRSTSVTSYSQQGSVVGDTDEFPTPSRVVDIMGCLKVYFFPEVDGWEVCFYIPDASGLPARNVSHIPKPWLISEAHYTFLRDNHHI